MNYKSKVKFQRKSFACLQISPSSVTTLRLLLFTIVGGTIPMCTIRVKEKEFLRLTKYEKLFC